MEKSLKELALSKLSGFRNKTVVVPEWEGRKIILREPSAEGWLRWQEAVKQDEGEELSVSQNARRNLKADVTLFIDVLMDENETPVFVPTDSELVEEIYGPVHSRLLKQALDLITSQEETKKKPRSRA